MYKRYLLFINLSKPVSTFFFCLTWYLIYIVRSKNRNKTFFVLTQTNAQNTEHISTQKCKLSQVVSV